MTTPSVLVPREPTEEMIAAGVKGLEKVNDPNWPGFGDKSADYAIECFKAMIATAKEDTDHGVPILPQNAATHITHFSNSQRYAVAAKEETPQAYKDALLDFPNTGNLEVVKAFDYLMKHAHTIRTALVSQSKDRWQIPDGYALVPIEATEQMLYMGYRHQYGDASTSVKPVFVIRDIYKAMIAAAPVEGE